MCGGAVCGVCVCLQSADGREIPVRDRLRTLGRALALAWDMPDVVRDRCGHPRFTRLAPGVGSSAVFRAYLGFGNVIERPGDFRLPAISNTLSGRHAGADYDCGLSLVQAVKVSPDFLLHEKDVRRFTLEADGDNVFYFVPSQKGAFEAAHEFAAVSGYRRSAGWESIAGKTCLDQQSGDYDATAAGLGQLARYGDPRAAREEPASHEGTVRSGRRFHRCLHGHRPEQLLRPHGRLPYQGGDDRRVGQGLRVRARHGR